jgi:hypothetical protein
MDKQIVLVGFPSGARAMMFLSALDAHRSLDRAAFQDFRWAAAPRNPKEIYVEGPLLPLVWKVVRSTILTAGGTLDFLEPARAHWKLTVAHAHGEFHKCGACDQELAEGSPAQSGICIIPAHPNSLETVFF